MSDIATANSLAVLANTYDANSIGSKLELLFAYLYQLNTNLKLINAKEKPSNYILLNRLNSKISNAEASIKSVISTLNSKIDEVENLND